jgi:hypothetical protein
MSTFEETGVDNSFGKDYKPIVALEEVKLGSGEEGEDLIWKWYVYCFQVLHN